MEERIHSGLKARLRRGINPLIRLWTAFGRFMAFVMTNLLLSLFFYFILTTFGFFIRIFGKDPLGKKFNSGSGSLWIKSEKYEKSNTEKGF